MSREYFDAVAGEWERMRQDFFSEAVREGAIEKAFALNPLRSGGNGSSQRGAPGVGVALDMGAGAGFVSRGLRARGLGVVAVDQSRPMLDTLERELPGVECRLCENGRIPLENDSVDYAFANMFLHHAPDPAGAIREMARCLEPGGALVITDLDEHSHEFLRVEHHDRWMGFRREDVLAWLREAGLEDARVECAGQNCCADSADGCHSAAVSIFMASGRKPRRTGLSPVEVGDSAAAMLDGNLFCAEAMILAIARAHGIESGLLPRMATGFCSGLSRTSGPCGALTGGVLALGMIKGRPAPGEPFIQCYELVQELQSEFMERFGSMNCGDITGYDFSTEEGRKAFADAGVFKSVCVEVVRWSAAMVQELLLLGEKGA